MKKNKGQNSNKEMQLQSQELKGGAKWLKEGLHSNCELQNLQKEWKTKQKKLDVKMSAENKNAGKKNNPKWPQKSFKKGLIKTQKSG